MAIVKVSKSGKQIQVVLTEDLPAGTVLATSSQWVKMLLHDQATQPFVTLAIMPHRIDPSRFKKSQVYDPVTNTQISMEEALEKGILKPPDHISEDVYSRKAVEKRAERDTYEELKW